MSVLVQRVTVWVCCLKQVMGSESSLSVEWWVLITVRFHRIGSTFGNWVDHVSTLGVIFSSCPSIPATHRHRLRSVTGLMTGVCRVSHPCVCPLVFGVIHRLLPHHQEIENLNRFSQIQWERVCLWNTRLLDTKPVGTTIPSLGYFLIPCAWGPEASSWHVVGAEGTAAWYPTLADAQQDPALDTGLSPQLCRGCCL